LAMSEIPRHEYACHRRQRTTGPNRCFFSKDMVGSPQTFILFIEA
jgi:hypothetical protein